jgi:hypothetical protein
MDEDFDTYEQYEPGPYTGDDLDGVDLDDEFDDDEEMDLDDDLEILDEDPAETAAGFTYADDYYA